MTLVNSILKSVSDERITDSHPVLSNPLRELMKQYNKVALNDVTVPYLSETTTGRQLKDAIANMDPELQVALLHSYVMAHQKAMGEAMEMEVIDCTMPPPPPAPSPVSPQLTESPEDRDRRRLRFIMKAVTILLAAGLMMIAGGALMFAMVTGTMNLSALWNKPFFEISAEIAKTIFSNRLP